MSNVKCILVTSNLNDNNWLEFMPLKTKKSPVRCSGHLLFSYLGNLQITWPLDVQYECILNRLHLFKYRGNLTTVCYDIGCRKRANILIVARD